MTKEEQNLREAITFLNELGGSNEIAKYFIEQGVKGKMCGSRECPVYNYLHNKRGFSFVFGVCQLFIKLDASFLTSDLFIEISIDEEYSNVANFIVDFDARVYPSLIS